MPSLSDRFWTKVKKAGKDKCWLWTAGMDENNYGMLRNGTKMERAHRVSWMLNKGLIPNNIHVLHNCDNPQCVNPNHLFLGTNLDNIADKVRKGRQSRKGHGKKGIEAPNAKLTDEQVDYIRKYYIPFSRTFGCRALGRKFGVCNQNISAIVNMKRRI